MSLAVRVVAGLLFCFAFFFLMLALLIGMWWQLIEVLIHISLLTNDVAHLFMGSFAICVSFLVKKYLFISLGQFLIGLFI